MSSSVAVRKSSSYKLVRETDFVYTDGYTRDRTHDEDECHLARVLQTYVTTIAR